MGQSFSALPLVVAQAAALSAAVEQPHRLRQPLVGGDSGALGRDGLQEEGAVESPEGREVQRTSDAIFVGREASPQFHQWSPEDFSTFGSESGLYSLLLLCRLGDEAQEMPLFGFWKVHDAYLD
ncbi:hypothetical protein SAY86_017830 [Trapa natans]|uniref:Uncharacterized protein n=1 Tax=Trapa natans TaxID=22666 RepID=A0AAN7LQ81_TRANT|nr:hypothetical protein SAY86_017830 [Trapa natans]